MAAGFTDANPYLRELTLKSMAVLGPKLSQKTLTQSLLKHLAKLQVGGLRVGHRVSAWGCNRGPGGLHGSVDLLLGTQNSYTGEAV